MTIKDLDQEFQDKFKKECDFWGEHCSDDSLLKNGILCNIADKLISEHKYKHCQDRCYPSALNIFNCRYCEKEENSNE